MHAECCQGNLLKSVNLDDREGDGKTIFKMNFGDKLGESEMDATGSGIFPMADLGCNGYTLMINFSEIRQ
jgi:hypothetical protein